MTILERKSVKMDDKWLIKMSLTRKIDGILDILKH